ncbi:propionyl-CoA synthetase [Pseudemcibacter aquimaris]|uniref:propionyl-CoA synthetase n=1 Tax=Pseudemcibacter aquimaris TaxID=2857064 RepID=UPI002012F4F8|nr:propionyl-CoA synthetase [Pseudemcibacter aquimaris]MCC3861750.1 propionyl-CoA synthetase [Pseudemcibacter aquimaris]WDU58519.1 propionyl-CoA synthetase [Pseudemcibacter aquimaris]
MSSYKEIYQAWNDNPEKFWDDAASEITWSQQWDTVLDNSRAPLSRWFPGAECNTCYNAVDRHVEAGNGDRTAIIYDSAMTGASRKISYVELQDQVSKCASMLRSLGVDKGDRVLLYMPMIPEAVIAMLASARLGAVHAVVFGGFAANELAKRISDAEPKVIVSASCGLEPGRVIAYKPMLDEAMEISGSAAKTIIVDRPECDAALFDGRDFDWCDMMAEAGHTECVNVAATDPLYILYTSGTTGTPKGIVRDNGGHMVAMNWSMKNVYDMGPGDVYWAASDIGWVVGHSYIVYAPLIRGCTTIMYEGKPVGTPDAGAFWRVIAEHKVNALFVAPTAIRAIKREDPSAEELKKYDISAFRTLFLAGERADPDTVKWCEQHVKVPVIDHWWQTETAWSICANFVGIETLPVKYGSPSVPSPGYDVRIFNDDGDELGPNELGNIVVKEPLPPGGMLGIWQDNDRAISTYFSDYPGYYLTGDAGHKDEDGYLYIMGRTDDVINVAGHRLSTGAMEEVLANLPEVAECAVVGVDDQLKGQIPYGFMVLKSGVDKNHQDIVSDAIAAVRADIGAVASFKNAVIVTRLPKTRSGKILRRVMSGIAAGKDITPPATLDDPKILDEIRNALGS